MTFSSNPLSLSVPEPTFESWLRDSGYLELLDDRTTQLHRLHSQSATTTAPATITNSSNVPSNPPSLPPLPNPPTTTSTTTTTLTTILYILIMSLISSMSTLLSLLTINPFAKLTSTDFSSSAPWTCHGFLGSLDSYSFPSSPAQAKMRVHENVKRFARNYAALLILFFVCSLYRMPFALFGLLSCLAVWEFFRFCDHRWTLQQYPAPRQVLIYSGQCVGAIITYWCNVQMAMFSALAAGYVAMVIHASCRKLTPAKQPPNGRGR